MFQGVRYTAVEGMVSEVKQPIFEANCNVLLCEFHVQKIWLSTCILQVNQEQIAEILARYFGTGQI